MNFRSIIRRRPMAQSPRPGHPGRRDPQSQRGSTLIEVLVTMVVLMVGLLGLVGLMVQSQRGQIESYQRIQALVVLQDMANRINTNRKAAACYVTVTHVGTTGALPVACTTGLNAEQNATADRDMGEWQQLLLGSSETVSVGGVTSNVGAMIGARGCVTAIAANVYRVTVTWQGSSATKAPTADADPFKNIPCAKDLYGADTLRRAVYQDVRIIELLI